MEHSKPFRDPADFYQDSAFPGRWMISLSLGIWILTAIFRRIILNSEPLPSWAETTQSVILLCTLPLYLIGFWKAVVGKGYCRILFLIALMPVIGVIVIYFLPDISGRSPDTNRLK